MAQEQGLFWRYQGKITGDVQIAMASNCIPLPRYIGSMSRGESAAAQFVEEQYVRGHNKLQESYTLGQKASLAELNQVYVECSNRDWDGYGAEPVSQSAEEFTTGFLLALPLGTPAPAVGAEPDGHITLEWHKSPYRTLSVSVDPNGQLHFAALLGASTQYGSEPFYGEVPQAILDLIYRVAAA